MWGSVKFSTPFTRILKSRSPYIKAYFTMFVSSFRYLFSTSPKFSWNYLAVLTGLSQCKHSLGLRLKGEGVVWVRGRQQHKGKNGHRIQTACPSWMFFLHSPYSNFSKFCDTDRNLFSVTSFHLLHSLAFYQKILKMSKNSMIGIFQITLFPFDSQILVPIRIPWGSIPRDSNS